MINIEEYTIATIASHNVIDFLRQLVDSLLQNNIKFKKMVIGNAGLLQEEVEQLREQLREKIEFIDFENQLCHDGIKTQSNDYKKIIDNRVPFLREIFTDPETERVIQLDADTAIISNDFSLLEKDSDITLTVREVGPHDHVLAIADKEYPNCGVIFWNNPTNCLNFLNMWSVVQERVNSHPGQYEQNYFYRATKTKVFQSLKVQKLHCRHYNCYMPDWISEQTSILHYKGHHMKNPSFKLRSDRLNDILIKK